MTAIFLFFNYCDKHCLHGFYLFSPGGACPAGFRHCVPVDGSHLTTAADASCATPIAAYSASAAQIAMANIVIRGCAVISSTVLRAIRLNILLYV
jgi:hypothetical protein